MRKLLAITLVGLLLFTFVGCGGGKELTEEQKAERVKDKAKAQNMVIVEKYIEKQLKLADFKVDLGEFVSVKGDHPLDTVDGKNFEHNYIVKGKFKHDGKWYNFHGVTAVDNPEDVKKYSVLQFYCKDLNHDFDAIEEGQ